MDKLFNRLRTNAEHIEKQYHTANQILNDAVKEAMPWASVLAMQGRAPALDKIERLATQLIAILIASSPKEESSAASKADAVYGMRW